MTKHNKLTIGYEEGCSDPDFCVPCENNQTLTNSMSNTQVIYYSKCPTTYMPYYRGLGLLMGLFKLKNAILTKQEIQIKLLAE